MQLSPEAQACFDRARARLIARGEWKPEFALGLAPVAQAAADYLRDVRRLPLEYRPVLEELHRLVREGLADFLMIPRERVPFAVVNAEGVDADIAELCAPQGAPTQRQADDR
jgi:hypothetical protein